ncbi:hypothetical protein [Limisphaera sp. VF-2]|jgi:hypothetical protein|uniref:hypothetical protein n=1 Tax=Limisphaera sp. VF-2 TaxID=3400418 RepID=UPI0017787946|nr:Plug domain-containing protein [Limisphaera sp.]
MKTTKPIRGWPSPLAWALALLLGLAGGAVVSASDATQPPKQPKDKTVRQDKMVRQPKLVKVTGPRETKRVITGSHIPREVKRMGQTADTPFPIHILDSRDIERSGAATVAEALRRVPAVR